MQICSEGYHLLNRGLNRVIDFFRKSRMHGFKDRIEITLTLTLFPLISTNELR